MTSRVGAAEQVGRETLDAIARVRGRGCRRLLVLMRHAARERNALRDDSLDPLTARGRQDAYTFGRQLRAVSIECEVSPVPRCVETGCLIRRGALAVGRWSNEPRLRDWLAPFYVRSQAAVRDAIRRRGLQRLLEDWVGGALSDDVMQPGALAWPLIRVRIIEELDKADNDCLLCVTHDWHLVLAQHFGLGQECWTEAPYLSSVLAFRRNAGTTYVMGCLETRAREL